jgi:hypothetical protein
VRRVVVRSVVARRVVERCSVVERSRRVVSVQLISRSVDPRSQLRLLAVRCGAAASGVLRLRRGTSGALCQAEQQFGRRVVVCVAQGPKDVVGRGADDAQRLQGPGLGHGSVRRAHLEPSGGSTSTWLRPPTSRHSRH